MWILSWDCPRGACFGRRSVKTGQLNKFLKFHFRILQKEKFPIEGMSAYPLKRGPIDKKGTQTPYFSGRPLGVKMLLQGFQWSSWRAPRTGSGLQQLQHLQNRETKKSSVSFLPFFSLFVCDWKLALTKGRTMRAPFSLEYSSSNWLR